MVNSQFLFLPANCTSVILSYFNFAPILSRKVTGSPVISCASPGFYGLSPIGMLAAIFFIVYQAMIFQFFLWQGHRFPVATLRTKPVCLGLLVRMKSLMADLTNAVLNANRFLIAFNRTILVALLRNPILPSLSTGLADARLKRGFASTFPGAIPSLTIGHAARRFIELFFAMFTNPKHIPNIPYSHHNVKHEMVTP